MSEVRGWEDPVPSTSNAGLFRPKKTSTVGTSGTGCLVGWLNLTLDWERLGNKGWNFDRFSKYANRDLEYVLLLPADTELNFGSASRPISALI